MDQNQIFDFKNLSQQLRNFSVDESGDKVNLTAINELSVKRSNPFHLYIKYAHTTEHPVIVDLQRHNRESVEPFKPAHLQPLYKEPLPVKPAVKKDLLALVKQNITPKLYHHYYEGLPIETDDYLFIWGFTSLSTLYRSYHDG